MFGYGGPRADTRDEEDDMRNTVDSASTDATFERSNTHYTGGVAPEYFNYKDGEVDLDDGDRYSSVSIRLSSLKR